MVQSIRSHWPVPILIAVITFGSTVALCQRGALTTLRPIDELTQEATLIVHGSVISAKVEPHPQFHNLMTVLVTMHVVDTLKGKEQPTIQFRQYIWDIRDQLDAAQYAKNEELVLLLGAVSPYGLRSPVGLEQGRFRVTRDRQGKALAANGTGNLRLFDAVNRRAIARGIKLSPQVTALAKQPSVAPVALSDLEDAIRSFSRTQ
ncbi:MAG: hypothetical protein JOZ10_17480 [Acidobacteria bacterium]|nr:hypothetical protein [Acidobacteriota bacterium]MBV9145046.1 hypothetical protein [Acidobacteriota bacterium]MBV9438098.1 hypothetical protein [Acidobacteriota bacterium]